MSGRDALAAVVDDLKAVESKLDAAAGVLVPVMTGTTTDLAEISKAVHDALNHLAGARLRVEIAGESVTFEALIS